MSDNRGLFKREQVIVGGHLSKRRYEFYGDDTVRVSRILATGNARGLSSVAFDGATSYADAAASNELLNFERTDTFSVFARFKTTQTGDTGSPKIISKRVATTERGWAMGLDPGGVFVMVLNNDNPNNNRLIVRSAAAVNNGEWRTGGFIYRGTSTAAGVSLAIDGSLVPVTIAADNLSATIASDSPLYLGSSRAIMNFFAGSIAEIWIYRRVLSGAELRALHLGNPIDTRSRVAHYVLMDSTTTAVLDDSGSEIDLTLHAPTWIAATYPLTNVVRLASGASSSNTAYSNAGIALTAGTGSGQDGLRLTDYNGMTKLATLSSDWVTVPDATSSYQLINRGY